MHVTAHTCKFSCQSALWPCRYSIPCHGTKPGSIPTVKKKPSVGAQVARSESAGDTSLASIAPATQPAALVDEDGVISPCLTDRLTVVTSSELPSSGSALFPPGPR